MSDSAATWRPRRCCRGRRSPNATTQQRFSRHLCRARPTTSARGNRQGKYHRCGDPGVGARHGPRSRTRRGEAMQKRRGLKMSTARRDPVACTGPGPGRRRERAVGRRRRTTDDKVPGREDCCVESRRAERRPREARGARGLPRGTRRKAVGRSLIDKAHSRVGVGIGGGVGGGDGEKAVDGITARFTDVTSLIEYEI